jgi:multidrug transporter EmrE-like cation transporter
LSPTTANPIHASEPAQRRKGAALVFCCTLLGAGAQILLKTGANQLVHPSVLGIITNLSLIGGLSLYGVSTVLLVLALRDGELSLLYPVIALTYVWVTMLSFVVFHDRANPIKLIGIAIIVLGVGVLGREPRK